MCSWSASVVQWCMECCCLSLYILSPLVFHSLHVCCCSYRNHLLFSGAKLEKVEENDTKIYKSNLVLS